MLSKSSKFKLAITIMHVGDAISSTQLPGSSLAEVMALFLYDIWSSGLCLQMPENTVTTLQPPVPGRLSRFGLLEKDSLQRKKDTRQLETEPSRIENASEGMQNKVPFTLASLSDFQTFGLCISSET